MSTLEELSEALHQLPANERWEILDRFSNELRSDWDRRIESDLKEGRLNALLSEARADIASGRTRSLNEVPDHD